MPVFGIVDKRSLQYALTDTGSGSGTSTIASFAGMAFGAVDPERYIVVAVGTSTAGGAVPSAVTIGGVAGSLIDSSSLGTNPTVSLWYALFPTGTTGTVAVTYAANALHVVSIGVYSVIPVLSVVSTARRGGVVVTPPLTASASIDIPATGIIIAAACGNGNNASMVWTGITEDADFNNSNTHQFSVAAYQSDAGETGRAVGVTFGVNTTAGSVIFAVIGP